MKHYELVVLLDSMLSKDAHDKLVDDIESLIKTNMQQKDDIGFLDAMFELNITKKLYFLSYYCNFKAEEMLALKKKLSIMKGVVRYVIYAMTPQEKFLTYADLQEKFKDQGEDKKGLFTEMDRKYKNKK